MPGAALARWRASDASPVSLYRKDRGCDAGEWSPGVRLHAWCGLL